MLSVDTAIDFGSPDGCSWKSAIAGAAVGCATVILSAAGVLAFFPLAMRVVFGFGFGFVALTGLAEAGVLGFEAATGGFAAPIDAFFGPGFAETGANGVLRVLAETGWAAASAALREATFAATGVGVLVVFPTAFGAALGAGFATACAADFALDVGFVADFALVAGFALGAGGFTREAGVAFTADFALFRVGAVPASGAFADFAGFLRFVGIASSVQLQGSLASKSPFRARQQLPR